MKASFVGVVALTMCGGCGVPDIAELALWPQADCAAPNKCVPLAPLGWSDPLLLWEGGLAGSPTSCPPEAPIVAWEGWRNLEAPHECAECGCAEATGACELPTQVTVSAGLCYSDGYKTSIDPPAAWDGACSMDNPIPANNVCPGGVKCVQSVTVGPVQADQGPPCAAVEVGSKNLGLPHWQDYVLACSGNVHAHACPDVGTACLPDLPPTELVPSGWAQCVWREGDHTCPDLYPAKFVAHDTSESYEDTRGCTSCACTEPTGGTCKAQVTLYQDAACSTVLATVPIGSTGPACVDVQPAGQALFAKTATGIVYTPGTCSPLGGEPIGGVKPTDPQTFCCRTFPGGTSVPW